MSSDRRGQLVKLDIAGQYHEVESKAEAVVKTGLELQEAIKNSEDTQKRISKGEMETSSFKSFFTSKPTLSDMHSDLKKCIDLVGDCKNKAFEYQKEHEKFIQMLNESKNMSDDYIPTEEGKQIVKDYLQPKVGEVSDVTHLNTIQNNVNIVINESENHIQSLFSTAKNILTNRIKNEKDFEARKVFEDIQKLQSNSGYQIDYAKKSGSKI